MSRVHADAKIDVLDERIYRTLVETAREGIGFVDVELGIIKYCNDSYAEILDSLPSELAQRSFLDFINEEQREKVMAERERRLSGAGSDYEVTITTANGRTKHVSATGSPILDPNGDCVGAVHTILDITERKKAENALRESEQRFRTIFDVAGAGMAQVAPDGRWLRVNRKLCEITGYTTEELMAMTFYDLTPPEDVEASTDRVGNLLEGKLDSYTVERRYIRKDGMRVWIDLSVSLARRSSGEPDYLICVAEDITRRKLSELIPSPLTSREIEVLLCLVDGLTNPQISRRLSYSLGTVKLDIQRILSKLDADNRKQAATKGIETGLVPPSLH